MYVHNPYAIICDHHGQVFLSPTEYYKQMARPDDFWSCPECGQPSWFDDEHYEKTIPEEVPKVVEQTTCDACGILGKKSEIFWTFLTMGDVLIEICEDCFINQAFGLSNHHKKLILNEEGKVQ